MSRYRSRPVAALLIALLAPAALGFEFERWDTALRLDSRLSVGAGFRVEGRDEGLVGKLNLPGQQMLCAADDCLSLSGNPAPNQRLIDARGGFAAHAFDNGNLNYDAGDLYTAVAKLNTTLQARRDDWTLKVGFIGFFDSINTGFRESHPNTTLQPAETRRSNEVERRIGLRAELREWTIQRELPIGERLLTLSIGAQRLRWGEANLHPLNTLDSINAPDAVLGRQPGLAISELAIPTPMLLASLDVAEGITGEAFYQLWSRVGRPEPQGSYFSSNDLIGGTYIEAAPGQFAEDPDGLYQPPLPTSLLTSSTRRVLIDERDAPDHGQFGFRLSAYAPEINDGTEFAFHYARLHSRLPMFSVIQAQASCLRRAAVPGSFAAGLAACSNVTGVFNGLLQANRTLATEPIPVDTERGVLSYPGGIHLIGLSFNTNIGGWAVSGEYTFRPNDPAQLLISDVLYAGAQQAFPVEDVPLLATGLPGFAGTTIPGARTFLPDFITEYRGRSIAAGNEYQPGEFVAGWQRIRTGQLIVNGLKILPGRFGAEDFRLLIEAGMTHVVGMPKGLYFQGQAEGTHPGPSADGSGGGTPTTLRLSPTAQTGGFATRYAWGLRGFAQTSYSNVLGADLIVKPTLLWFEDLGGIAPFPAQNYVSGNRFVAFGAFIEFSQQAGASLFYQYFDGRRNTLQDRDNLQLGFTWEF